MPAPQGTKRVKGHCIERPFIIGSQAWTLDDKTRPEGTPADHTKGWKVYVKGTENGPDITTWLKKVQFKLHQTYANNTRTVESPPFEVNETGWGGFQVEIRLHFVPESNEKPQWRSHVLQLEPYGSEADMQAQKDKNLVVSEICEFIDFNEPVEPFFNALTSEDQWRYMDAGKGKGAKGKSRQSLGQSYTGPLPREERTAQLPQRTTPTNPYSRETESATLDMLRKAQATVTKMIEAEKESAEKRAQEMRELLESGDMLTARKR
ncbi:MAG: NuA4 histone H4 acetyltransferase complex and the SWR1 complex subunit [Bogoriella megaspora]|nr:MAG: NuA4 histone H4 acetyltransferase complex and the SWR1 complex subunit [Bogoriella megaspora]